MIPIVFKVALAFIGVGFTGYNNSYIKETRDAQSAIELLGQMKELAKHSARQIILNKERQ